MFEYFDSLIPSQETFVFWLEKYGNFALFILMALGIIALPVPEETLMVITGALIRKELISEIPFTLLAAYAGSCCGITVSYLIGRSGGHYLLHKYGWYVGISEEKMIRAHEWYERIGKWSLVICYFIPGIRHFAGVFAGMSELNYFTFALFAYSGALLWVTTFIFIGYFFGKVEEYTLTHIMTILAILLIIASVVYLAYLFNKRRSNSNNPS